MNRYPFETNEFAPIVLTNRGVTPPLTDIELMIKLQGARPTGTWSPVVVVGSEFGFIINGLAKGIYNVWAKVHTNIEDAIFIVDTFTIT